MPTIPFPNIPAAPGVPPIPRRNAPVPAQRQTAPARSTTTQPTTKPATPAYRIIDSSGNDAISCDAIIEITYRGENKVSTFPVAGGGFSSFNKVSTPFEIRVSVATSGAKVPRATVIKQIDALSNSIKTVSIVTPDGVYKNCNLVSPSYGRRADKGIYLLKHDLVFTEIRQTAAATFSSSLPATAQPPVTIAPVRPQAPTDAEVEAAKRSPVQ